jgi:hypothetical protein
MTLAKIKDESEYEYQSRLQFIESCGNKIPDNQKDPLSKVWANIKFRNCKYSKTLYIKITSLDKTLKK